MVVLVLGSVVGLWSAAAMATTGGGTPLPAAMPNLLVNGTSGIAVGMATNMIPHNLVEVVDAARHLLTHPGADLDELMRFVPGPDLPTGGQLLGMTEVRAAYETGRGVVRMRATAEVGPLPRGRSAITVTELPYGVGTERVIAKVKELVTGKKLQGIADLKDLTDRQRGTQLVIEVKAGFAAQAVLTELYRLTPLEESFGINALALVDGQPRTLDEIGREFGLTRERIRQIESKTLSKLRHPSRSQKLRDYLD